MNTITTDLNWCSIDRLDGDILQDGETLRIRFPDGCCETHVILVVAGTERVQDMAVEQKIPTLTAYAVINYHGSEAKIPLAGLMAERARA